MVIFYVMARYLILAELRQQIQGIYDLYIWKI